MKSNRSVHRSVANTLVKWFSLLLTPLFLWMAYVQLNDPDPVWWVGIYTFLALLVFSIFRKPIHKPLGYGIIVCLLLGAWWVWPEKFEGVTLGKGDIKNIEEGRESLGLMLSAVLLFILHYFRRK